MGGWGSHARARGPAPAPAPVVVAAPPPAPRGPGRKIRDILHEIADKVEQKSKNVRVVFRNFDKDKSGNVDYGEFRRGLAHLGIALSDADFETLLGVVDNDGSGTIDYNEFVEGALPASQQQPACNGDSRLKEAPLLSRIEGRTGCSHSACV